MRGVTRLFFWAAWRGLASGNETTCSLVYEYDQMGRLELGVRTLGYFPSLLQVEGG